MPITTINSRYLGSLPNRFFQVAIRLCLIILTASVTSMPLIAADTMLDEAPPPWSGSISGLNASVGPAGSMRMVPTVATGSTGGGVAAWYRQRNRPQPIAGAELSAMQARAQAGDSEAQYQLGVLYQSGRSGMPDAQQAEQWFERAAKSGHAFAQYALALIYRQYNKANYTQQSLRWQQQAAQKGHVQAQYGLGMLYANGQYVPRDLHKARHWLQQAAQRGSAIAQLALRDLPVNNPQRTVVTKATPAPKTAPAPVAAVRRPVQRPLRPSPPALPIAAASGSAHLAYAAGAETTPVATRAPQQLTTPKPLPTVNAENANRQSPVVRPPVARVTTAVKTAADKGSMGSRGQVEHQQSQVKLEGMSVAGIRQSAETGDKYAQLMYGALFEDGGEGIQQNPAEALRWYLKAARQGYPKAQHNLALLYEDGKGTQKDYKQAAIWYKKAADAGFSEAQNNLAVLYILGKGVPADQNKAEQLLRAAVAQGNTNAKRNLGMLMNGEG